jgi:Pyruvate/2-oxoacid:ferredoxin oxidoreductase gamma subunit
MNFTLPDTSESIIEVTRTALECFKNAQYASDETELALNYSIELLRIAKKNYQVAKYIKVTNTADLATAVCLFNKGEASIADVSAKLESDKHSNNAAIDAKKVAETAIRNCENARISNSAAIAEFCLANTFLTSASNACIELIMGTTPSLKRKR